MENRVVVHNAVESMSLEDIKGIGYLTNHLVINLKILISRRTTHPLHGKCWGAHLNGPQIW